jgi:hypothetical protein
MNASNSTYCNAISDTHKLLFNWFQFVMEFLRSKVTALPTPFWKRVTKYIMYIQCATPQPSFFWKLIDVTDEHWKKNQSFTTNLVFPILPYHSFPRLFAWWIYTQTENNKSRTISVVLWIFAVRFIVSCSAAVIYQWTLYRTGYV